MANTRTDLSIFERSTLDQLVQRSDVVIKAGQVVKAVEVLANIFWEIGKQAIPAIVGFTIKFVGAVVESAIITYAEVRSQIRQAQIDQACNAFIRSAAAASMYSGEIAKIRKMAAAQDFVRSLHNLGITGITVEQALLTG